jgi:hypothetical protein
MIFDESLIICWSQCCVFFCLLPLRTLIFILLLLIIVESTINNLKRVSEWECEWTNIKHQTRMYMIYTRRMSSFSWTFERCGSSIIAIKRVVCFLRAHFCNHFIIIFITFSFFWSRNLYRRTQRTYDSSAYYNYLNTFFDTFFHTCWMNLK